MKAPEPGTPRTTLKALLRLARPYKNRFLVIALLALFGTGADLLQPLIYRLAINDVAGLFVAAKPEATSVLPDEDTPATATDESRPRPSADSTDREEEIVTRARIKEPHTANTVAPRTRQETLNTLLWAVVWLFLISVVGYFLSLAADYQSTVVASHMEAGLIQSTFGHVLRLPLSFFSRRSSGGLGKRIDQSDQVAPIVSAFSQQIAPETLRIAGICGIMLYQNWRLTVVALALLPLYFYVTRRSAVRLESGMAEYYGMWENVSMRIQDALAAIKTVKLSGAESREVSHLHAASHGAYADYLRRTRLGNRYLFFQSVLSHLSKALVLGYGGYMVLEQSLTPGDVVMFVAYLDRLYDPIDALSSIAVNLQQHVASLDRAVKLLETGPEEPSGAPLQPGPGHIEFRDVHFGYTSRREVLQGIGFRANPGEVTAIVGPSGAGKSTAVDLLLRLWTPNSGEILIDGQNIAGIDPSSVRRAVGIVAADGAVFRGTLADNIRYKRPAATDDEVRAAALAAGLGPTLERLPDGLDTEVGERGSGLSVGERQRLQIARVLADQPRILILDEATANLDYATEGDVKRALAQLQPRPTMLVIAHRYSMVRDAGHVIVLDQGKVVEQGSPEALLTTGGWFSRLAAQSRENASVAG